MPLPPVFPDRWTRLACLASLAALAACSSGAAMPPAVPTFSALYDEIFDETPSQAGSGCWGSSCHAPIPDPNVAIVDFSTRAKAYQSLVPEFSDALIGVLTSDLDFLRMPKGEPRLSPERLARIMAWLDAGAKND